MYLRKAEVGNIEKSECIVCNPHMNEINLNYKHSQNKNKIPRMSYLPMCPK